MRPDPVRALPTEVVAEDLRQHFGLDIRDLDYALVFVDEDTGGTTSVGLIAHSKQPIEWRGFPPAMLARTDYGTLFDRPYRRGRGGLDLSIFVLADSTLIVAPDETIRRMLTNRATELNKKTVANRLAAGLDKRLDLHVVADFARLRDRLKQHADVAAQQPVWSSVRKLAENAEQFELRARVSSQFAVGVVFETASAASAQSMQAGFDALLAKSREQTPRETGLGQHLVNDYFERALTSVLAESKTQVRGSRFQVGLRGQPSTQMAACASAAMLMKPVLDSGHESVRWLQSVEALGRLSQAMSEYVADHGCFPPYANFSPRAKPLLSWRVHLLPYLGHQQLYDNSGWMNRGTAKPTSG